MKNRNPGNPICKMAICGCTSLYDDMGCNTDPGHGSVCHISCLNADILKFKVIYMYQQHAEAISQKITMHPNMGIL